MWPSAKYYPPGSPNRRVQNKATLDVLHNRPRRLRSGVYLAAYDTALALKQMMGDKDFAYHCQDME